MIGGVSGYCFAKKPLLLGAADLGLGRGADSFSTDRLRASAAVVHVKKQRLASTACRVCVGRWLSHPHTFVQPQCT